MRPLALGASVRRVGKRPMQHVQGNGLMDTTQWLTRTIGVYRDDPVWAVYQRWFNVPLPQLQRLWLANYEIDGDTSTHGMELAAIHIRKTYPDAVLIY